MTRREDGRDFRPARGRCAVSTYYARLSQRLISAITAPTAEGRLYEVDMRLRPSGESGPIASSLAAFAQYQREVGLDLGAHGADPGAADRRRSGACAGAIAAAIRTALTRPRDPDRLLADVADMRRRIAESHPRAVALGSAQPPRAGWSISNSPCNT